MFKKTHIHPDMACASLLFGLSCLVGYEFTKNGNWDFMFQCPLAAIGIFAISTIGFYLAGELLTISLPKLKIRQVRESRKHETLLIALFILLCWLPHIILYYPGAITYDTFSQLRQYTGQTVWTDAHPPFSTWIMGVCLSIGRWLGSDRFGVFLFTFSMCIGGSLLFAYTFRYLKVFPRWVSVLFFAFFAFVPLWPSTFYTMTKDIPYTLMVMGFTLLLVDYVNSPEKFWKSKNKVIAISAMGILACLIRPNALLIVLTSGVGILLWKKTPSKKIGVCFAAPVLVWLVVSKLIVPAIGITQITSVDKYIVPFQQIARYVKYCPDDITEEQENILKKYFYYDRLAENYNPVLADPIKGSYVDPQSDSKEWLEVWLEFGIKHPGCYVQAWIHQNYGYYSPIATVVGEKGFYYNYFSLEQEQISVDNSFANCGFLEEFSSQRINWENKMMKIAELPIIKLLYIPGTYFWIVVLSWILLKRCGKSCYGICLIPAAATFVMTLFVPVNTHIRYALPLILSAPFMFAMAMNLTAVSNKENVK